MSRETLQFDVVIVGAGPAGLAAACRIAQLARQHQLELSIAVIEKAAEIGSHIVSGAIVDSIALDELFPDWQQRGAPLGPKVSSESVAWLRSGGGRIRVPRWTVPASLRNHGHRIASLGALCRWLAEQAESLGADLLTGFAATEVLLDDEGKVCGVATGATGLGADGSQLADFDPGYELRSRCVLLAEGCRGNLAQELEARFDLRRDCDVQHYALGFKEVWTIPAGQHREGHVEHTIGWPLDSATEGGGFIYHAGRNRLNLGFVVALNYSNPWFSPYEAFQQFKQHPSVRGLLEGGSRIAYGARAINKGGLASLPTLGFPGGLLLGCDAGFLNGARLKGIHAAMKSGMLAAEAVVAMHAGEHCNLEADYDSRFRSSWLFSELRAARNFSAGMARFGTLVGGALALVENNLLRGRIPWTLGYPQADHDALKPVADASQISYGKPDRTVSFDRLESVHLANIGHREDQPCHLVLQDPAVPVRSNLPTYGEPATRYCPAAVYEIVTGGDGEPEFRINAGNCIHCKTCEIKDPAQNIRWIPPEGGSGPNYADL